MHKKSKCSHIYSTVDESPAARKEREQKSGAVGESRRQGFKKGGVLQPYQARIAGTNCTWIADVQDRLYHQGKAPVCSSQTINNQLTSPIS